MPQCGRKSGKQFQPFVADSAAVNVGKFLTRRGKGLSGVPAIRTLEVRTGKDWITVEA